MKYNAQTQGDDILLAGRRDSEYRELCLAPMNVVKSVQYIIARDVLGLRITKSLSASDLSSRYPSKKPFFVHAFAGDATNGISPW